MKKVIIKYNPYKLETEIKVDGRKLAQNSKLGERTSFGARLQEWIEDLPRILIDEYNDNDFDVTFHGTLFDFEDMTAVFTEPIQRHELTAKFKHKPGKETKDKDVLINEVFKEIQAGPLKELSDKEIISAFENAKSSDFEVCVVATMSAGKSTLINAMLGTKLMPSRQEACTAIITRLKDVSEENVPWRAVVYNKEDRPVERHESLTYPTMERLNADENVFEIKATGNIPFVSSKDVSLVLIDTPGPNNSRDPHHKKVQIDFLDKSSKSLVIYIMTGEFGSDDDNTLLKRVAESTTVGGKQSRDRFIFVVNKLDDLKKEDGDTNQTLERVRSYLKTHGVFNPNLFPAAALPALNLRLIECGAEVDEDTKDETKTKVRKLNRNENLHFETYASLPNSIRESIAQKLSDPKIREDFDNKEAALIHTGIPSVEAAIRQYVQKYAKTAKIKNIVDRLRRKLEDVRYLEKTKSQLAKHCNEKEIIVNKIDLICKKIDDINLAIKFKNSVDDAVAKVKDESKIVVKDILNKFQIPINEKINELRNKKIDLHDAQDEIKSLEKYSRELIPDLEFDLDKLIRDGLANTISYLLEEYRNKLTSLAEIDFGSIDISISPLKLMSNSLVQSVFPIKYFIREGEIIESRKYRVKERTRGWFESIKFWPTDEFVDKVKNVWKTERYIDGNKLAQTFLAPMQNALYDNCDKAQNFALEQSERITEGYNAEFKRLDEILKQKLSEFKNYATDKKRAEERILESEGKLDFLKQIEVKLEEILEI